MSIISQSVKINLEKNFFNVHTTKVMYRFTAIPITISAVLFTREKQFHSNTKDLE